MMTTSTFRRHFVWVPRSPDHHLNTLLQVLNHLASLSLFSLFSASTSDIPSWVDLTSSSILLPQIPRLNDSRRTIEVDSEGSDSGDNDEIQVLNADGTIVLDDSVNEPGPSSSNNKIETRSMSRKRKSDDTNERISKKIKKRKGTPEGLVEDLAQIMNKYGLTEDDVPMMKRAIDSARVLKKYSEAYPRPDAST